MTVKTVACLAGDGVGPELMAAATRALDSVTRLHAFELDDVHLPFAGEAVTRSGHPLPAETRDGYRRRRRDPRRLARRAGVRRRQGRPGTGLARRARPRRARRRHRDRRPDGQLGERDRDRRARSSCAASRHGRVVAVGDSRDVARRRRARASALGRPRGRGAPARRRARPPARAAGEPRRRRHRGGPRLARSTDAAATSPAPARRSRTPGCPRTARACSRPRTSEPSEHAGFGVVDPMGMLLTASLMLAEGLKRRAASRTLERAVGAGRALADGRPRTTRARSPTR